MKRFLSSLFFITLTAAAAAQVKPTGLLNGRKVIVVDSIRIGGVWRSTWPAGGGGGGISSVIGTANRITSTGGVNPVLNIPTAFEDLFIKNAQNNALVRIGSNLKIRDTSLSATFNNELLWNQTKGAFRANRILSVNVNHIDSIGLYSAAFGIQNKSKGIGSVTFGSNNNNNADYSLVSSFVGSYTAPNTEGTNILGYAYDSAFYQNCFITGIGNSAYGTSNTLMGWGLYGRAVNQMVFGVGNDTTGYYQYDPRPVLVSALKPTDALFTFANGVQNVGGPQVVTRSNALQIYRNGTADVYNVWSYKNNINGSFTDLSLITKRYADSALNKKMLDSAFDVIRPATTGTVSPFDKLSSTQLRISDLKNSATVTWTKDGDGNISATAAGGGGGMAVGGAVTGGSEYGIYYGGTSGALAQSADVRWNNTTKRLLLSDGLNELHIEGARAITPYYNGAVANLDINANKVVMNGVQINSPATGTPATNTAFDASGNLISVSFAPKQTVTSGTATTVNNDILNVFLNPASVLASHTITLPSTPIDGQEVNIFFGGTVSAGSAVVTSLTIAANGGQTLYQALTPTTANGGDVVTYVYNNTVWYRKK